MWGFRELRIKGFATAVLLCVALASFSQEKDRRSRGNDGVDLDEIIQDLVQLDDDVNYEDMYESMFQYQRNKINLNNTTAEELRNIYILSDLQINSLMSHIDRYGKLLSIYELQSVPGFDLVTIATLLNFAEVREQSINISNQPFLKRLLTEENNSLIYRIESPLEDPRGYMPVDSNGERYSEEWYRKFQSRARRNDSTPYLGGSLRHLLRFRVNHRNDFQIGLTATKGSGEQFTWDPSTKRYGFDFYSMHFVKYNVGRLKRLALGDYQLQFGQGLIMAGGFAIGKGSETTQTLRRSNTGIRPYTSTIENGFLRGGAATVEVTKTIDATVFASYNRLDGSVLDTNDLADQFANAAGDEGFNVSLVELTNNFSSGFHRKETELEKKRLVGQAVGGANLSYVSKDRRLKMGATYVHTQYEENFNRQDRTYNALEFNGTKNSTYGVNYSYNWQNFNFFGEVAQSKSKGVGLINGFVSNLSQKVEYAMLFRHYSPNFHSFYGNAFGEASRNINETGLYWGLKLKPSKKITVAAYYDKFNFPWLSSRTDNPTVGDEYLMQFNYKISRKIMLYARTKVENKERNAPDNITKLDYTATGTRKQYLLNMDYNASNVVSMKSRVQFSTYDIGGVRTRGYAIIQDFNFRVNKWTFSTRYALFDTDDSDNRQFVYEKDVLYAFAIPAYNGKGIRTYVVARYKASRKLDFWLKVGRYLYAYENDITVGSSLDEIAGNHKTTARFQMRIKL